MITLDVDQGSPEWFSARCGVPSASNFDKIITTKGEPSKQAQKYAYQLAAERVSGKSEESYTNAQMQRGRELEEEARKLYEMNKDVTVQQVGVCYPDDKKICCASPDGLVGKDGLVEIKCPMAFAAVTYLLENECPIEYFQQIQGQLYITGRKWLDFVSYYPGLKPLIIRINRDEKFISSLAVEIEVFNKTLIEITERIK